jgi:hypothetical protein
MAMDRAGGGSGTGASGPSSIQLVGQPSYTQSGSQLTLNVPEILNASTSTDTGTLRVELWLTAAPYAGGNISGDRVAIHQLSGNTNGALGPSQYFDPFSVTVPLTNLPGPGSYYASLLVTEYNSTTCSSSDHFCIDTYGGMANQFVVANSTGTGGSSNVVLSGSYSYSANFETNTLQFSVSQISNTSTTYTTNPLRLEWWVTASPYAGVSQPGNRIATWQIQGPTNGQLSPGQWFQGLTGTTPLTNLPAGGTYYITMVVSEYTQSCGSSDGYCVDTYGNFQKEMTVPAASTATGGGTPSGGTSSGGDGSSGSAGSGGGGSMDLASLILLALLVALQRSTCARGHRRV